MLKYTFFLSLLTPVLVITFALAIPYVSLVGSAVVLVLVLELYTGKDISMVLSRIRA